VAEKKILEKLRGTSAVTTLCGASTSIRGGELRKGDTLPGIAVTGSQRPVNKSAGTTATEFADIEVQCIAERYDDAHDLADVVKTALNGFTHATGLPNISMTHVQDVTYAPGPWIRGEDKVYEMFTVNCLVQYATS